MAISNLLTISDFGVWPYLIPADNDFGNDNLDDLITEFQPKVLISILGHLEYSNYAADFSGGAPQTQKWIDFTDGSTFTATKTDGTSASITWDGIKPILKKYIYAYYLRFAMDYIAQTGQVIPGLENATRANIGNKFTNAINEAIEYKGADWAGLFNPYFTTDTNLNTKLELRYYSTDVSRYLLGVNIDYERVKPTAYNYLYYNRTSFTDWAFKQDKKINIIGI